MHTMRKAIVGILAGALLSAALPPSAAEHNSVGFRVVLPPNPALDAPGAADSDALRPVYHAGGHSNLVWATTFSFRGDLPRESPRDQWGLGYTVDCAPGSPSNPCWIGYFNGVVEHVDPIAIGHFPFSSDRLYRARPDPAANDGCDQVENRANPDRCTGTGHLWHVEATLAVEQPIAGDPTADPNDRGRTGAGFAYPGRYSHYIYLLGEGSSGITAPELGLPSNACQGRTMKCELLTPADVRARVDSARGERAGVCLFSPDFVTLSGTTNTVSPCRNISEFNSYVGDTGSPAYVSNKPGWAIFTISNDPTASLSPWRRTMTASGERDDIGNIFHYYVNPRAPAFSSLWCLSPPILTDSGDGLAAGVYQVAAHDVDVYTSPQAAAQNTATELALQTVADTLRTLRESPVGPILAGATEEVNAAIAAANELIARNAPASPLPRLGPAKANEPEPNAAGDTTGALTVEGDIGLCSAAFGLRTAAEARTATTSNLLDATVAHGAGCSIRSRTTPRRTPPIRTGSRRRARARPSTPGTPRSGPSRAA